MDEKIDEQTKVMCREANRFGFTVSSFNPSGSYGKFVDEDGLILEVFPERKQATLSFTVGVFSVEARYFAWPHQGFKEIFLEKARELKKKIERT